jgi:hypothetical protein
MNISLPSSGHNCEDGGDEFLQNIDNPNKTTHCRDPVNNITVLVFHRYSNFLLDLMWYCLEYTLFTLSDLYVLNLYF